MTWYIQMVRQTSVQTSRLCRQLEDHSYTHRIRHVSFLPRVLDINPSQTIQSLGLSGHVGAGASLSSLQAGGEQTGPEVWECFRLDLIDIRYRVWATHQ